MKILLRCSLLVGLCNTPYRRHVDHAYRFLTANVVWPSRDRITWPDTSLYKSRTSQRRLWDKIFPEAMLQGHAKADSSE